MPACFKRCVTALELSKGYLMRCVLGFCVYWITFQAMAADLPSMLDGRGVWLEHSKDLDSEVILRMRQAGIKRVHVMSTSSPESATTCAQAKLPRLLGTADKIATTITALESAGFVTILTLYLPPTKAAVDSLTGGVIPKAVAAGVDGIEFDLEGGWSKHPACGYPDHKSVFADLRVRTKTLKPELPVGITTHSGRANDPRVPKENADWLSLQLYSTCKPTQCEAFTHPTAGPGGKQHQAVPLLIGYTKPVIIGLAAYSQKWDGYTVDEAMRRALNESLSLKQHEPSRFVGHSYWSNDSGLKPGSEAFKFLVSTSAQSLAEAQ